MIQARQCGLTVLLPTPAYMLAMKILANRLVEDVDKVQSDLEDAVALMKVTGISTRGALVGLIEECYPHVPGVALPTMSPRVSAKIDALLDSHGHSADARDPAWHAGRGPATRQDQG
ncbi:MAG: hypothetical protein ABSG76_04575 [Xanthobacteraceae bacterium]|jgi:hypothetical protein